MERVYVLAEHLSPKTSSSTKKVLNRQKNTVLKIITVFTDIAKVVELVFTGDSCSVLNC